MNRFGIRKAIYVLLGFYLFFYTIFFFYSIFTLPSGRLLKSFMWSYIWINSSILFIDYLIPISASAFGILYSLFFKGKDLYKKMGVMDPFYKLISSNLALLIILSSIYTVLVLGFHPAAHHRLDRIYSLSRQARIFLDTAKAGLDAADYPTSLTYFNLYLAIDRKNEEILEQRNEVQLKMFGHRTEMASSSETEREKTVLDLPGGMNAYKRLEMAKNYFAQEDYFSAHYHATLAYRIDGTSKEAMRIAAEAWEKISTFQRTDSDEEASDLFKRKKEGYTSFISGDYISAYHTFNELKQDYPDDPDVRTYLGKSRDRVTAISFFLDEAEKIAPLPGLENILFINYTENGNREIVFIGKMVSSEEGIFFQDIEALCFKEEGGIVYHLQAPYGKFIDNYINMEGIHRSDPELKMLPVYFSGSQGRDFKTLLRLDPPLEDLKNLRVGSKIASSLSFASLWQVRKELGRYGYIEEGITIEIIMRLLLSFCFLILSLLSISLGWAYRARYLDRPPIITFLFIPFFPFVFALLTSLFLAAQRVILGFVLVAVGFTAALILMLVIQAVLFVLALILLAGQKTE